MASLDDQEPSGKPDDPERRHKQSIILRKDLNMRKGKMVAQGAHASWAAVLSRSIKVDAGQSAPSAGWFIPADEDIGPWLDGRFAKICLGIESEAELIAMYEKAKQSGLPCALIRDAGLTEFAGVPTLTAVAVGPAEKAKIDAITSALKPL